MVKKGKEAVDYGVLPLEGLWWADDMNAFIAENRNAWKWTAMIMQPKYVTQAMFQDALEQTKKKKPLPTLAKMRFESLSEGLSAQTMHIGPYAKEGPTIERIHSYIQANGYEPVGKHHEIYTSATHGKRRLRK
jgi:hypothetical protein